MYKVLLADDEPYALVVLRKIIVWEEHSVLLEQQKTESLP